MILARRAFVILLLSCFVPFVVRVVQVYLFTRFPEVGRVLPVDGRLFGEFLNQQIGLTVLLSIFGGAGLVANDLRTGAILVYRVEDYAATVARVRGEGVTVHELEIPHGPCATFTLEAGQRYAVYQLTRPDAVHLFDGRIDP